MEREDRHCVQIQRAIRNGRAWSNKHNTEVTFEGDARSLSTFEGPRLSMTGKMDFWHWESHVMSVDFDRDMITDFGYMGYSHTTSNNIRCWHRTLCDMEFMGMESLLYSGCAFLWTDVGRRRHDGTTAHREPIWERFRTRVPWVRREGYSLWFAGALFDVTLMERYRTVYDEIHKDKVSWHWFKGDWDPATGAWQKSYIDDAARVRHERWLARRARKAAA